MNLLRILLGTLFCVLCCLTGDTHAQEPNDLPVKKVLPFVVFAPKPAYPINARAARAVGPVKIDVKFDPEGDVVEAKFVSGNRLLRKAALKAARKWRFNAVDASIGIRGVRVTFVFHRSFDGFVESTIEDVSYKYRINLIYLYES